MLLAQMTATWLSQRGANVERGRWSSGPASSSRVGMAIRVRVPDPMGPGTGMIFYPWVAFVPDPN
jgi:hypothetical protein